MSGIKFASLSFTNEIHDLTPLIQPVISRFDTPELFEEPIGCYKIPAGASGYVAELEQRRGWNSVASGEEYKLKLVGADFFLPRAPDPVLSSLNEFDR